MSAFWKLKNNKNRFLAPLYSFLYRIMMLLNSASIGHKAIFANEPYLPHGVKGIFISQNAKIGKNCIIFQQVTIGSNVLIDSKALGAPTIGDNCYIGAGAKIIGNIKIGNNVRVGANAVVYKDVPDNAVVTSGEQKVILKGEKLNNKYYLKQANDLVYFENDNWVKEEDSEIINKFNDKMAV